MPRASRSPWPPSIAWFGRGVEVIGSSGMSNTGRNYNDRWFPIIGHPIISVSDYRRRFSTARNNKLRT